MDWHQIVSFTLIAVVITVSPGPNFVLVTRSVAFGGQAAAFSNIPGFAAAILMHGTLSIFGVAALLSALPNLLTVIQAVGALYLLYLGTQSFAAPRLPPVAVVPLMPVVGTCDFALNAGSGAQLTLAPSPSVWKGFADGLLTSCLNPKTSLFYYAVFPQITAGSANIVLTSCLLIGIHIVTSALWFFMVAMALGQMFQSSGSEKFIQMIRKGSGIVLLGFSFYFAAGVAQAISNSVLIQ